MTLTYQYPVVYFYGDDEEDSEIVQKEGRIEPLKPDKEPYEAIVSAEGYSFHILFGSQIGGMFLCIPGWHMGCELSHLNDIFWNRESISRSDESFRYENKNTRPRRNKRGLFLNSRSSFYFRHKLYTSIISRIPTFRPSSKAVFSHAQHTVPCRSIIFSQRGILSPT